MARIGYARVSTHEQNVELQRDTLKEKGCTKIFTDKITGTTFERKELNAALAFLREGDVLVVWKLDRLGRSLKHLIETVTTLQERNIGFISLTESIDTTTPGGKLIFHIMGALAEFERDLIGGNVVTDPKRTLSFRRVFVLITFFTCTIPVLSSVRTATVLECIIPLRTSEGTMVSLCD